MRFRKSIKVLPGVRLNMSNSGISWTVGRSGASVNFKSGRSPRTTVGIPGTGLSWSSGGQRTTRQPVTHEWRLLRWVLKAIAWFAFVNVALFVILLTIGHFLGWFA